MKVLLNPEYIPSTLPPQLEKKIRFVVPAMHGWCTTKKAVHLAELILEHKPKLIVEIGVFAGRSIVPMGLAMQELGAEHKGQIIGIDPWSAQASKEGAAGSDHEEWWGSFDHDPYHKLTVEAIKEQGLESIITLWKMTSVAAKEHIEKMSGKDLQIDMIHIDGNHADKFAVHDVELWLPALKQGGVVIFDDINWASTSRACDILKNQWCGGEIQDCESYAVGIKK